MQVGRFAAAVVVIGAVISGCGGPIQAGTAAFVGDNAIPLERVQTQLDAALAKKDLIAQLTAQGGSTAGIARSIVTRAVMHDLLTRRAAEDGIVVTDAQIDTEINENGGADALLDGSLYDLSTLRERMRDDLIAAQLAQRAVGGLAVTADLVAATSRENAAAPRPTPCSPTRARRPGPRRSTRRARRTTPAPCCSACRSAPWSRSSRTRSRAPGSSRGWWTGAPTPRPTRPR
jgi:hypothetical protein